MTVILVLLQWQKILSIGHTTKQMSHSQTCNICIMSALEHSGMHFITLTANQTSVLALKRDDIHADCGLVFSCHNIDAILMLAKHWLFSGWIFFWNNWKVIAAVVATALILLLPAYGPLSGTIQLMAPCPGQSSEPVLEGWTILYKLAEADMMRWQWHQLNHLQAICASLQKITMPAPHHSGFRGPDALQSTASKHWRQLVEPF